MMHAMRPRPPKSVPTTMPAVFDLPCGWGGKGGCAVEVACCVAVGATGAAVEGAGAEEDEVERGVEDVEGGAGAEDVAVDGMGARETVMVGAGASDVLAERHSAGISNTDGSEMPRVTSEYVWSVKEKPHFGASCECGCTISNAHTEKAGNIQCRHTL